MALASRRPRRRPFWLLVAALLTGLVLLVDALAGSGGGGDGGDEEGATRPIGHLDQVRPLAERSAEQGADLAALRDDAPTLDRRAIDRRLDELVAGTGSVLRSAERLDPPKELERAHALFVASMAARAHAATTVHDAVDELLDGGPIEQAVSAVADAGRDLLAGDRTYKLFRESVPSDDRRFVPASAWVTDGAAWDEADAQILVAGLRSGGTAAPTRDAAVVTFTVDPVPVTTEGDVRVLPSAKSVKVQVVVANTGNQPLRRLAVVASVKPEGAAADTARDFVDLAPGERTAVSLGGLRPPASGPAQLTVRVVEVEGEANVTDNERGFTFVMR